MKILSVDFDCLTEDSDMNDDATIEWYSFNISILLHMKMDQCFYNIIRNNN